MIYKFKFTGTALIIFCAALAAAKPREEIQVNALGCPFDAEIVQFLPHEYCHQFYQCVGGTPITQTCPADLLYNEELSICDWPINVNCDGRVIPAERPEGEEEEQPSGNGHSDPSLAPKICATEDSEGVLVAHEYCNKFYVCQGGRPVSLACPANLFYNPENEQCDWPFNVNCGGRFTVNSVRVETNPLSSDDTVTSCSQYDSEGALIAHENCNRFYKCNGGKPVALDCPAGLVFNIEVQYCDWSSNVECGDRTIAEIEKEDTQDNGAWTPEHGHSDPSQAPAICAAEESNGVLVAHENCSQFYKCDRRVPVTVDCPASLLYHPELEICDWPQNVDCAGRNQ